MAPMPRAKAALFDLDGTLLDPNGSIRATLATVMARHGLAPLRPEESLVGMPLREIFGRRSLPATQVEAMIGHYRQAFADSAWQEVRAYPGVADAVAHVRASGLRTAVVTTRGEGEADLLLQRFGQRILFDAVVGDDDVRPVKPHPAPVLEACRRLGVPPSDAVMVGDTRYDVEAGRAAGCHTIGVRWGHGNSPGHGVDGAHVTVDQPAALATAVLAWARAHPTARP